MNQSNFETSQRALSKRLGVSRQLIAYHVKRERSPKPREDGRYDVQAWRAYLREVGRKEIAAEGKGELPLLGFNVFREVVGMAQDCLFHALTAKLPEILIEQIGPKIGKDEARQLAMVLFYEFMIGFAFHRSKDHANQYITQTTTAGLDDLWRQCGFRDETAAPKKVHIPMANEIQELAASLGIEVDGDWTECDTEAIEKEYAQ